MRWWAIPLSLNAIAFAANAWNLGVSPGGADAIVWGLLAAVVGLAFLVALDGLLDDAGWPL